MKIEPIYVTDDHDMKRIMELRGKVVELETAMAAKDEALREIEIWCNDHDVSCEMACEESHKIAEAALSPPTGKVLGYCEWRQEDPFGEGDSCIWHTDCGHEFVFDEGTPSDNDAKFCCYCGKKLVERVVEEVK